MVGSLSFCASASRWTAKPLSRQAMTSASRQKGLRLTPQAVAQISTFGVSKTNQADGSPRKNLPARLAGALQHLPSGGRKHGEAHGGAGKEKGWAHGGGGRAQRRKNRPRSVRPRILRGDRPQGRPSRARPDRRRAARGPQTPVSFRSGTPPATLRTSGSDRRVSISGRRRDGADAGRAGLSTPASGVPGPSPRRHRGTKNPVAERAR